MHTNIITKKIHRGIFLVCLVGVALVTLLACEGISSFLTTIKAYGVSSISIDQGDFSLKQGDTLTLTATVVVFGDTTDTSVIWTSDNQSVATVDAGTGEVTAVKEGTAKINVLSKEDFAQETSVTVTVKPSFIYVEVADISYVEVAHGTAAIENPTITGVTITGYTLAVIGEGTGTVVPPTIDPTTGAITVKTTTTAGTYKITATTAGTYKIITTTGAITIKSLETMFYVTTHPTSLSILETAVETGIENFGLTADLNYIKTDAITDMTGVFSQNRKDGECIEGGKLFVENFNGDISKWDVSNVINMSWMFEFAIAFESDISLWDVRKVENMFGMFYYAIKFNKDISKWKVDSVEDMSWMFYGASVFDNNLSGWNVANVTNMFGIFWDSGLEKNTPSWYKP